MHFVLCSFAFYYIHSLLRPCYLIRNMLQYMLCGARKIITFYMHISGLHGDSQIFLFITYEKSKITFLMSSFDVGRKLIYVCPLAFGVTLPLFFLGLKVSIFLHVMCPSHVHFLSCPQEQD